MKKYIFTLLGAASMALLTVGCQKNLTIETVSYTHLDVYKRQTNGLATDSRYATTEKINVESAKNGYYGEEKSTDRQTYADVLSTFNKSFELGKMCIRDRV